MSNHTLHSPKRTLRINPRRLIPHGEASYRVLFHSEDSTQICLLVNNGVDAARMDEVEQELRKHRSYPVMVNVLPTGCGVWFGGQREPWLVWAIERSISELPKGSLNFYDTAVQYWADLYGKDGIELDEQWWVYREPSEQPLLQAV